MNFIKQFEHISNKFTQLQFDVRINIATNELFNVEEFEVTKQICSTRNIFSQQPIVIIADPFLFVHKDELFLFYEKQIGLEGKGEIKMKKTKDLKTWTRPKLVLNEKFHLSYPYVFKADGRIFMMPETHKDKSLRLYVPNNNLTQWKPYKTILRGRDYVDSAIIFSEGKYFLFTTIFENLQAQLFLYYADTIDGAWTEHPQSPLNSDINVSRCAGSPFFHQDKLYRPVQRFDHMYGDGVDIYQINKLTIDEYSEEKILNVIPNSDKFYSIGGHHFNPVQFQGKQLVATDALTKRVNVYEVMRRFRNKFRKNKL